MLRNGSRLHAIRRVHKIDLRTAQARKNSTGFERYVLFGEKATHRLTQSAQYQLPPALCPETFVKWARKVSKSHLDSPRENAYMLSVKVRELVRSNKAILDECEAAYSQAEQALYASTEKHDSIGAVLDHLDLTISNAEKGINELKNVLVAGASVNKEVDALSLETIDPIVSIAAKRLKDKLQAAHHYLPFREQSLEEQVLRRRRLHESELYKNFHSAKRQRDEVYKSTGLQELVDRLHLMRTRGGSVRQASGTSFEDVATEVTQHTLVPFLARKHNVPENEVFVIRNTKLGLATAARRTGSAIQRAKEFDCIVCVEAERPARLGYKPRGTFCKVLGIVEFKRNVNDCGSSFLRYQRTLCWLAGMEGTYDPEQWKTRKYLTGHFKDSPFVEYYDNISTGRRGQSRKTTLGMKGSLQRLVLLTPESFQAFVRTPVTGVHAPSADEARTERNALGDEESLDLDCDCTYGARSTTTHSTLTSPVDETSLSFSEAHHNAPSSSSTLRTSTCSADESERAINSAVRSSLGGLDALFLHDLYFVTRDGEIDGMHSKQKDWALNEISRDPRVDVELSDEDVLEEIRAEMLLSKQHSMSTMEMLHLYKVHDIKNQICLVGKFDV